MHFDLIALWSGEFLGWRSIEVARGEPQRKTSGKILAEESTEHWLSWVFAPVKGWPAAALVGERKSKIGC